ncbi:hypothetical protein CEUSTIGMA_g9299.t1 [Chlamydomonas eustigma]|uniref:UDENN domain-containing protein n=1 Tax=Chlamydomonas eustigma TaxID=1157962 RepID=A0A250XFL9_9CHLO|nr:hypothetical protein CEUSTIGMA_g9299.t1 [Chlamydomonas eustigma]|eukprot:GAX81871.1 hypothetical protein CEUSTIGMA_g9299.t1 [Chlamydomonas eustigma]
MNERLVSRSWLVGMCSVLFDVDVGPRVSNMVPDDGFLTREEKQDVAFHAFPDSMSLELHAKTTIRDSCFFFRVKRRGGCSTADPAPPPTSGQDSTADSQQLTSSSSKTIIISEGNSPASRNALNAQDQCSTSEQQTPMPLPSEQIKYLYGFVFCRQRQDPSLLRGGEQLSVVVLSEHPLSSVLRPLSQVAGAQFFSHGKPALGQLYHEVQKWPAPVAGLLLQLPAGLTTLQTRLPSWQALPHPSTMMDLEGPLSRGNSIVSISPRSAMTIVSCCMAAPQSEGTRDTRGTSSLTGVSHNSSRRSTSSLQNFQSLQDSLPFNSSTGGTRRSGDYGSRGPSGDGSSKSGRSAFSGAQAAAIAAAAAATSSSPETVPQAGSSAETNQQNTKSVNIGYKDEGLLPSWQANSSASGGTLVFNGMPPPPPHSNLAPSTSTPPSREGPYLYTTHAGLADAAATAAGGTTSTMPAAMAVYRRPSTGLEAPGASQGAFCEVDLYTTFQAHLPRLWQLWEMILMGQPLLVVGLTPADCGQATAAALSLIAPLAYQYDFRPYFTIHDVSFGPLSSGQLPSETEPQGLPRVMGVTNLYFLKALSHWPNVISVGRKEQSTWIGATAGAAAAAAAAVLNPGAAVRALRQRARGAQSLMVSHSEGLWSSYRPITRPDSVLLARLLQPASSDVRSKLSRIAVVNNEALRRHFHDLTSMLLAPFSRYKELGADGFVPRWEATSFLAILPTLQHAAVLSERFIRPAQLLDFYARFITTANFKAWIDMQQRPLVQLMAPEPLPAGPTGAHGRPLEDVELVGMFFETELKLQEAQARNDQSAAAGAATHELNAEVAKLRRQLACLFFGMPEDLQWTCISNPARRSLLASLQQELDTDQRQQMQRLVARLK